MRKFLLSLLLLFIFPFTAHAAGEFTTSLDVTYTYTPQGTARVRQDISLTNNLSQYYATGYQLIIQGDTPKNLIGYDNLGPLKITTSPDKNSGTLIDVQLNEQVVGKGKVAKFTLEYQSEPAKKTGQVWEIALPKIASGSLTSDYSVHLVVPAEFGKLAFASPQPSSITGQTYTFTGSAVAATGVSLAFGDFQTFGFKLQYHLKNTSPLSAYGTITLPPDTNYQKVYYDSLDPKPESVTTDVDGNWLATYLVSGRTTLDITAAGQVHLLSSPAVHLGTPSTSTLSVYLEPQKYWESSDPLIQNLASDLKTPRQIYNYVVKALSYDDSQVSSDTYSRKGAVAALKTPDSSLCQEFTDLFIALSRAAGIPAREVNGFAYTDNPDLQPLSKISDVLHAWPQYWDSQKSVWINVDPTWGNTTGGLDYFGNFDLNHFAFVIHGAKSDSPRSAGEFKSEPDSKDIEVTFSKYQDYPLRPPQISWSKPPQFFPLTANTSQLHIINSQNQALYNIPVRIESTGQTLASSHQLEIPVIPPYGEVKIPIEFSRRFWPDFSSKYLAVAAANQQVTYNISQTNFLVWHVSFAFIISGTIIGLAAVAHYAWGLHLRRRKSGNNLRR